MIMITPGEQYLAYIDLPEDHYPAAGRLRDDLDDAIMTAAEMVIAEWKSRDPLLRALLHEECVLNTWAPYPAGQLPAGTEIRLTNSYGKWQGTATGGTHVRYSTEEVRVSWTVRAVGQVGYEPTVEPTTEVDAWVPIPCDLSAVLASIDGYPPAAPVPAQRRARAGAVRLTPPMIELLTDIATHEEYYITQWSKWDRTAQALISRKLAFVPKGCHGGRYPLRITDDGKAEAARRGIIDPPHQTATAEAA